MYSPPHQCCTFVFKRKIHLKNNNNPPSLIFLFFFSLQSTECPGILQQLFHAFF